MLQRRLLLQSLACTCSCRQAAVLSAQQGASHPIVARRRWLSTSSAVYEEQQLQASASTASSTATDHAQQPWEEEDDILPDFHDKFHARKLTSALAKRKKRIVRRVGDESFLAAKHASSRLTD